MSEQPEAGQTADPEIGIAARTLEAPADTDTAGRQRRLMRGPARRQRDRTRWLLAALLLFAFVLRAWNLDWDRGTHLQPDERFWSDVAANVEMPNEWRWSEVLDPEKSTLNPRVYKPNYVYGTLPLWASEAAAAVLMTDNMSWAVSLLDGAGINLAHDDPGDVPVNDRLRFNTGFDVTIIGRLMSALVDTATVGAVFVLARELADRQSALLAAVLQTCTVLHIQYSHFLGSEPWVAFFVTVVVWGAVRLARGRGGWPTRLITAVALGFAIGSKLSGVAAAAAPAVAALLAVAPDLGGLVKARIAPGVVGRISRTLEPWFVMAIVAVAAYRLAQPYDFQAGLSLIYNARFEADIEYLTDINQGGNWPWVQPLVGATPLVHPLQQVFWWGMGPGLALAAAFGGLRAARRVSRGEWFWAIPLSVVAAYLVLVSLQFYAIVRYLQPAYPTMVALGGVGLVAGWRWAVSMAAERPAIARALKAAVVLSVATTVFWALAFVNGVYNHDNARMAASDWVVDNLPAGSVVSTQAWDDPIPWGQASPFEQVSLEPFSFGGDSPERIELLIAGLDRVDYVIESSNKFYDSLPRTPARFPQMSVYYDRLFDGSLGFELIKTFRNPPSLFGITIDDSGAEEAFTLYDHPTVLIWQKTDRFSVERAYELLQPDRARVAINVLPADGATNASMLTPEAYATQQAGSSWSDVHPADPNAMTAIISWFAVTQLAALAVAPALLRRSGEAAGAAWGLTKVLGMLALSVPVWLVVSWGWFDFSNRLVWFALAILLALGVRSAVIHADELRTIVTRHRRVIVAAETLFIGVFAAVVALRLANPDLWHPWRGGEKPMELAYFTAVTGSTTMPPYDPWLAGGSLNYYYFGWFILAVPTRILGIAPDVAFNLGVATTAAIAAATVFSTTALITDLAARARRHRLPVAGAGLFGALLFLIIGNLDSLRQVISRLRNDLPLSDFDWWDPSRVNKNAPGLEVTEFPAWTVLFADLHPHFMAMGVFGVGLAGCLALIERARQGKVRDTWVLAGLLGAGSGVMRMVHTWDLPTYIVAACGAIVFGALVSRAPTSWRLRTGLGQLVVFGVAHLAITSPYRARNLVADSGFSRAESSTNLDDWLAHWGLFLFVAFAYLVTRLVELRPRLREIPATTVGSALFVLVGFVGLHLIVGSVAAWSFVALGAALVVIVGELRNERVSTAHLMAAAMWALGFAVLVAVESFTQNADIQRLNTVFKFWLQVWHLFAVAAAFGAVWVVHTLHRVIVSSERTWPRRVRRGFTVGLTMLVVASLLFPLLAVRPRSANRFDTTLGPSLDGHLWLEPGTATLGIKDAFDTDYTIDPGLDRPVIEWLRANVEGRPTIVEAVGGAEYQWWGRISITTGLPTVLGWRWHQDQQRTTFNAEVNERKRDVADFFRATSMASIDSFLRAYDVSYVVIGAAEAEIAAPETLELFSVHPALTEVFSVSEQRIYEVAKRSLAQSSGPMVAMGSG